MKALRYVLLSALAFGLLFAKAPRSEAQISFGVNIGAAPACPYGYFSYRPYRCAPYGYYGPEWFNGGTFVGAGPWYRGPAGFYGHVDRHYDPRFGYHGGYPEHGGYREPPDHWHNFHGGDMQDGHGNFHGGHR